MVNSVVLVTIHIIITILNKIDYNIMKVKKNIK